MVDVSLPMDEMHKLSQKCKDKKFTWIDHHISAITDYTNLKSDFGLSDFCQGSLEVGKAACELTWNYFFPDNKMPLSIALLGDYDVWRNTDKAKWNDLIMPFQLGIRLICNSAETFPEELLHTNMVDGPSVECRALTNTILEHGQVILAYQKKNDERAAKSSFVAEFKGLRALCLNIGGANSTVFDSKYNPEEHDIMMIFAYNGKCWKATLYSAKEEVNCSIFAKELGGGGHHGAAGFQTDDIFKLLKSEDLYKK
jgi:oligoribonuclease NrnB/cAMP/cGMP phosphodiesterase (DHH superfamily)